jgi:hypothetical protein
MSYQLPSISFAQCHSPTSNPPEIVGNWEWTQTSGGFAGEQFTPEQVGYAILFECAPSGILSKSKHLERIPVGADSVSLSAVGWTVLADLGAAFPHPSLQYQAEEFCVSVTPSPDGKTLEMTDACSDCYASLYSRSESGLVAVAPMQWGKVKRLFRSPE